MAKGKKQIIRVEDRSSDTPKWMITYADFIMLILVFFILLFSISQMDEEKFDAIAQSFKEEGLFDSSPSIVPFEDPIDGEEQNDEQLDSLMQQIQQYLESENLQDTVIASRTDRGVVIVLQEQVLFNSGEAEILPQAFSVLDKVGELLEGIPNFVRVEGHTDDRPIQTAQYPSNWELSTARSSSVLRYMLDSQKLESERFAAVGYGDTRPEVPNDGPANWTLNRRVEIVILNRFYEEESEQ
ncbi:flagellar motor protein MotS [Jeotgalibacillus proteolyticus]|uniref:flagellar motor protein MotS n=1 Tax=Jeotgalibacillus proteolyticus TaxID=2082395 RepID=UPI003CF9687C